MSGSSQQPRIALPALVPLSSCGGDWAAYVDLLYGHFRADFIDSEPRFPQRRWALKRHPEHDGKAATFWHIITEGTVEADRTPNLRRCERIRWPRPIIDAIGSGAIRAWYQNRQRNGVERRLALATPDFSYLVVLAVRRDYVMLWTAFCVQGQHRRNTLRNEHAAFVGSGDSCP